MSNVNIKPQTVLLTSGQAVTFEATDAKGLPISVSWGLNPPIGTLVAPAVGTPATSAAYVAPSPLGPDAQTIALIASTASDSASATISLTPIAVVPAKVDLKADQEQRFFVSVEAATAPTAASTEKTTWILSPLLGSLDEQTGLYKAPHEIPESTTVHVIATTPTLGKQGIAIINLTSTPWQGLGVNILGGFLLLVFSLVFLMVGLWPPALPSPDTAAANRIQAEKTLEEKTSALQNAEIAKTEAAAVVSKLQAETNKQKQSPATPGPKSDANAITLEAANAKAEAAEYVLQRAVEDRDFALQDLEKKRRIEETVNDPNVKTKLAGNINRELDLIWLVLLAGSLGSFLHMAQSYSEYIGNRTIKSSWAWWYSLGPFIGAGLALVFYAAMRGGFMAIATGSNAKASELNPFGLVAVAALAGMFSKAATIKLGEVFDTLFKSDKAKESKDPVAGSSQTSNQAAGKVGVGASSASTGTK